MPAIDLTRVSLLLLKFLIVTKELMIISIPNLHKFFSR